MRKKKSFPRMCSQDGVTLFELMVVIALVGILSAAAIPSYLKWRSNAKFIGASSQLIGDFQMAKGRAIRINARVVVQLAEDGYAVFEDNGALANDGIRQSDETILTTVTFDPEITLDMTTITFIDDRAHFDGRGTVVLPTGVNSRQMVLKGKSAKQTTFTINRLGRIKTT